MHIMGGNSCSFDWIGDCTRKEPVIAVDLGYSSSKRSCGIAWSWDLSHPIQLQFGPAIDRVASLMLESTDSILIIEAPLSTYHGKDGNPGYRGEFERGRGWYYGAGASTYIAALRLVDELAKRLPAGQVRYIAEAFLSHKEAPTPHKHDASIICREFWHTPEAEMVDGVSGSFNQHIMNVPSVHCFQAKR